MPCCIHDIYMIEIASIENSNALYIIPEVVTGRKITKLSHMHVTTFSMDVHVEMLFTSVEVMYECRHFLDLHQGERLAPKGSKYV